MHISKETTRHTPDRHTHQTGIEPQQASMANTHTKEATSSKHPTSHYSQEPPSANAGYRSTCRQHIRQQLLWRAAAHRAADTGAGACNMEIALIKPAQPFALAGAEAGSLKPARMRLLDTGIIRYLHCHAVRMQVDWRSSGPPSGLGP